VRFSETLKFVGKKKMKKKRYLLGVPVRIDFPNRYFWNLRYQFVDEFFFKLVEVMFKKKNIFSTKWRKKGKKMDKKNKLISISSN
jgi:hypothetical protein